MDPAGSENPLKAKSGFRRFVNAARYSLDGLGAAYRHEHAFRLELLATAMLVPFTFWLDVTAGERALLISSVLLVLIVELINSAIEAVVDRVSFENHPLSKRSKDLGSAAVCLSLVNAAAVWLTILVSRWPLTA
jgi:diacylglycerol kinase (ATP)